MIRVGLVGGRGYVGNELLTLLDREFEFEVVFVGSESKAGSPVLIGDGIPMTGRIGYQALEPEQMFAANADVWILAQSNGYAASWLELLHATNAKFLDVSYDFRFDPDWVYGLPEKNSEQIRNADRVANPGCYATAVQLALLPIVDRIAGVPVAFGVSGYSGAGSSPGPRNNPELLADNLIPYSLVGHGHEKEISFQLGFPVRFLPHVAQFFRGISATIDVPMDGTPDSEELLAVYQEYYRPHPLVEVTSEVPEIRDVAGTPKAIIGGFAGAPDSNRMAVVAVIDNLLKGAASQALQNLKLMFDIDPSH